MNTTVRQTEILAGRALALVSGVAGAIALRGGPAIQKESDAIGFVETGQAAVTGAGRLPSRYVIHAVGPVWGSGDEDGKLRQAVLNSLLRAEELGLRSIAFPAVSSGIFGFPKDRCARVMLRIALDFLRERPKSSLRDIRFCLIDGPTLAAFEAAWDEVLSPRPPGDS
jgi:O-acetyl-ADP-ribose deacetylase (regulator of RNase III)